LESVGDLVYKTIFSDKSNQSEN